MHVSIKCPWYDLFNQKLYVTQGPYDVRTVLSPNDGTEYPIKDVKGILTCSLSLKDSLIDSGREQKYGEVRNFSM